LDLKFSPKTVKILPHVARRNVKIVKKSKTPASQKLQKAPQKWPIQKGFTSRARVLVFEKNVKKKREIF